MAFGKNDNKKESLPRFGSKEMRASLKKMQRPTTKGGSGSPFFRAWVPPPGRVFAVILHSALHDNILLENGEKVIHRMPYYRYGQHWVNSQRRFGICSAFPYSVAGKEYTNYSADLCGGCAAHAGQWVKVWVGGKEKWQNDGPVGRCNETFAFSVTILGPFYEVDGSKINPKTGAPYAEHVLSYDPRVQAAIKAKRVDQLFTTPAQRFIWNLTLRDTTLLFGGEDLPEGADVVDDQLNHICQACGSAEAFSDDATNCVHCGAGEEHRVGLFDRVLYLKAAITGTPKMPGGRPPTALQLVTSKEAPQGWAPIPENLVGTEYLEPIPLAEKLYPLSAEQQQALYGIAPKVTRNGKTGLVDDEEESQLDELSSNDIPF